MAEQEARKSELFAYEAPWNIYGLGWSQRKDKGFRLAIGSFIEEYKNKVQVVQLDEEKGKLVCKAQIDHPYPTTKIMWMPETGKPQPDLFATTGDYLRLWKVAEDGKSAEMECVLNDNEYSQFCAPLTSFDWSETSPNLIGTSSIDTTCSIWDLNTGQETGRTKGEIKTQLIAHDQEVYDISFAKGRSGIANTFATVGADGSVRMFDLRNLDHSTVVYEDPSSTPLLRVAWNRMEDNAFHLAAIRMDDAAVILLDIRSPCVPVATLSSHEACVNGISWAPHSPSHIATAGDDKRALIWDIRLPKVEAILAYEAAGPINQIQWASAHPDWIGICFDHQLEILRV